jgi:Kdo2-lipid IVA lauroyltransferase/acyltransferase
MADPEQLKGFTRFIFTCFRCVPLRWRIHFFTSLSLAFYYLSPRRRLIALHNLRRAFPEKSMTDVILIAKGVYRNMAIVAAEFFDIPWLTKDRIQEMVEVEGLEHCVEALKKKRGLLMVSAHFGNWELQAIAFSLLFQQFLFLYRPLDNLFLDRLVTSVRSLTGNRPLAKKKAMRQMLLTLRTNGIVGLLIDQNWSWQEGVFVDFFGRPACTSDGLARLALHTGAPVIPGFIIRLETGKYRMVIGKPIDLVNTGERKKDVFINTQNFTRIIEDMIRKYPNQWFWVHQRWKTQPHAVYNKKHDSHAPECSI